MRIPRLFTGLAVAFIAFSVTAQSQTQLLVVTKAADAPGTATHCTAQTKAGSGTDAACSLRDALAFAASSTKPAISISFDSVIFSATNSSATNTITLTSGALSIPSRTSIAGPTKGSGQTQSNLVTISGNKKSTVFTVASGATSVVLSHLNIVQGQSAEGGGIVNAGTLSITDCTISGNATVSTAGVTTGGGGILNSGTLTINGSTISANSATASGAQANGGGINNFGNLKLVNSTVAGNSVTAAGLGAGGGIFTSNAPGSSLTLSATTVSGNSADGLGGGVYSSRNSTTIDPSNDLTLQTLGDSITYGYNSTGCPAPYQTPTTLADSKCWAGLVAYNLGYALHDIGVSGSGAGDVSETQIYNSPHPRGSNNGQFIPSAHSVSTFLIGEVDDDLVPDETSDVFNGTRQVTEWQMIHEDIVAFMLTPNKKPVSSSACTASSGWSTSTLWTAGLQTTTNGAQITCPITGSTAYISVMAQVGNASTISISIDGGPSTPYPFTLTSPTRELQNPTAGELFRIPNLLPVLAGGPASTAKHTLTITANVSGTDPVFLNWMDGNGNEAHNGTGPVVFALSMYQSAIRTDANGTLPRFRALLEQEAGDLRADGLNEIVGDLSVPCTQLPISDPPVSLCDTFDGTHPVDSGEAIIAGYVEQLMQNAITFSNSIVSGNTAPVGADSNDIYADGGGNQVGVSGIDLAPLGSSSGLTATMPPMPGSPAICAGISANLSGLTTDQRGLPRTTAYGPVSCIDAGAVQTNYSMAFTTQPPTAANVEIPIDPAPALALRESGQAATFASSPVAMADSQQLLTGDTTVDLAGGSATFHDLLLSAAAISDRFTGSLALTPTLNLSATSTAFQVTPAILATMISPAAGTTLPGATVTFNWTPSPNATDYHLLIGSTGVGSDDLYNSAPKTVTSYTFTRMPVNGATVYVRLITDFNGTWLWNDYKYTEGLPAVLASPKPGSTLSGAAATFTWSQVNGATSYYLWIGTTGVGSNNVCNSEPISGTSYAVNVLPTNNATLYVRLITNYAGVWVSKDYTYTEAKPAAQITSPVQGSTLPGSSVPFTWTAPAGVTGYYLHIGSTGVGSDNIYNSEEKTTTTYTFPYMPTNGETIYVRLNTNYNGTWVWNDYVYKAAMPAATLISPVAGSTLPGPNVAFKWSPEAGANDYYIWIGTTGVGSYDLIESEGQTGTSYSSTNIPTNGKTVYVRIITNYNQNWVWNDYTFTEAQQAAMASPAPASVLPGSTVPFSWTNAANATGYYLWIGSTGVGSNNIYNSQLKTVTSYTFNEMPTNGKPIYARLITNYNGTWDSHDYVYTAANN